MADDLKDPKPLSVSQADFLRNECPSDRWQFYGGGERYKFADKLPTTPKRAVEKWDYVFVVTSAGVSGFWFKIQAEVRGESVRIYIDNELVLQEESFLKNPTGKIGFRNVRTESALVKDVKVEVG